ncbi:hypothetical protein PTSG_11092 [Salpingoeca rosetta]|uniref:Uncharacterized protein n=1 Tax=Salpingoeca rosetta (strain ATCC 50818 / BSB-021) TaxID=946362 RepID=F2US42_SALR5|nr:uncharacterized protein PTSG_11092 [Salpingoeca rosetta]EGD80447.1 hypothetical protein PTSG_11092 [Salpingoeca rosetta]|eukprot:XP_004988011.1 hypothetical protein PTSG_11092 [Salpingoeca rosetta]
MSDTSGDGSGGDYGSFTWESARVLAAHLHAIEDEVRVRGQTGAMLWYYYDDIFATVTDLLQRRGGRFITAYRIRTARSFQHSVIKWGLDMVQVPLPPALDDADVASSTRLLAFSLKHHHEQQQPPSPPPPLPPTAHKANAG